MRCGTRWMALVLLVFSSHFSLAPAGEVDINPYLIEGRIGDGVAALEKRVAEDRDDNHAQFALGIFRTLSAVEGLSQDLHRHGLQQSALGFQFLRLPIPENKSPEPLTYDGARKILQDFVDHLTEADEALSRVDDRPVKVKLPFGRICLDLDGDGQATEKERFWRIFVTLSGVQGRLTAEQQSFEIAFDKADVHWLRGYTHVLRALAETILAHDTQEFFKLSGHLFFAGAPKPEGLMYDDGNTRWSMISIMEIIAAIHELHFDVVEPERMKKAHAHLKTMVAQSRLVWVHLLAETDDDREWIPSPKQTSILPLSVTQEQVKGWDMFLDVADDVLDGKQLIPHWRLQPGMGINLKKVFLEPRRFDLVMWSQGRDALPFSEEGKVLSQTEARDIQRLFQNRFWTFAIWFN